MINYISLFVVSITLQERCYRNVCYAQKSINSKHKQIDGHRSLFIFCDRAWKLKPLRFESKQWRNKRENWNVNKKLHFAIIYSSPDGSKQAKQFSQLYLLNSISIHINLLTNSMWVTVWVLSKTLAHALSQKNVCESRWWYFACTSDFVYSSHKADGGLSKICWDFPICL